MILQHAVTKAAAGREGWLRGSALSGPALLFFQMLELLPAGLLQPPTVSAQPAATAAPNLETLRKLRRGSPRVEMAPTLRVGSDVHSGDFTHSNLTSVLPNSPDKETD